MGRDGRGKERRGEVEGLSSYKNSLKYALI